MPIPESCRGHFGNSYVGLYSTRGRFFRQVPIRTRLLFYPLKLSQKSAIFPDFGTIAGGLRTIRMPVQVRAARRLRSALRRHEPGTAERRSKKTADFGDMEFLRLGWGQERTISYGTNISITEYGNKYPIVVIIVPESEGSRAETGSRQYCMEKNSKVGLAVAISACQTIYEGRTRLQPARAHVQSDCRREAKPIKCPRRSAANDPAL